MTWVNEEGLAMTSEKGGLAKTLDDSTPCPCGFFDGNFFRPNFVLENRACQAGGIDLMRRVDLARGVPKMQRVSGLIKKFQN